MHRTAALPPALSAERGFTLLEMLVVLAITGLIAGLLYPQIETAKFAVRQRVAREQMAAAVEAARAAALRGGGPVTLSADQGSGALVIAGTRRMSVDPAHELRFTVRPQTIVFYPDGSSTGGQLVLGTGRTATEFEVSRASGRIVMPAPAGNGA